MKGAINRSRRHAIQLCNTGYLDGPVRAFWRQTVKPLPQLQQGIRCDGFTPAAHSCPAHGNRCPPDYQLPGNRGRANFLVNVQTVPPGGVDRGFTANRRRGLLRRQSLPSGAHYAGWFQTPRILQHITEGFFCRRFRVNRLLGGLSVIPCWFRV